MELLNIPAYRDFSCKQDALFIIFILSVLDR